MRFLFVYQDYAEATRTLVASLGVVDVEVIVARKSEDYPSAEEINQIGKGNPAAAICQVVRRYKNNIKSLVDIQYEAKQFRREDQQLREWLIPAQIPQVAAPKPSEAIDPLIKHDQVLVAEHAFDTIDEIHERRHPFVQRACALLVRYADGEALGPMRDWKSQFNVDFAPNGRVSYRCEDATTKKSWDPSSWHLKEGDNTTPDDAARIYFNTIELDGRSLLVVSYAGPHPTDGKYSAKIKS